MAGIVVVLAAIGSVLGGGGGADTPASTPQAAQENADAKWLKSFTTNVDVQDRAYRRETNAAAQAVDDGEYAEAKNRFQEAREDAGAGLYVVDDAAPAPAAYADGWQKARTMFDTAHEYADAAIDCMTEAQSGSNQGRCSNAATKREAWDAATLEWAAWLAKHPAS